MNMARAIFSLGFTRHQHLHPTSIITTDVDGCQEMAITNPFDSEERFRFATLSKTAVKLWE
jgi:hypothetical protein